MPEKMYEKTASDEAVQIAFKRLKRIQKEAAHPVMFQPPPVKPGMMRNPPSHARPKKFVRKAKKPGFWERAPKMVIQQAPAPRMRMRDYAGYALADRIRDWGKSGPKAPKIRPKTPLPPVKKAPPSMARKALRYGGLGALGLGVGAAAHQVAQSVGASDSGPADVIADMVAPRSKYSYDREATMRLGRREMYIPRFYLEKAAAEMAGALEDNEGTMFHGSPQMHGAEASVIPRQTLHTATPIQHHVDKTHDDDIDFLDTMFEAYRSSRTIGKDKKEVREVPLAKQAGRLAL